DRTLTVRTIGTARRCFGTTTGPRLAAVGRTGNRLDDSGRVGAAPRTRWVPAKVESRSPRRQCRQAGAGQQGLVRTLEARPIRVHALVRAIRPQSSYGGFRSKDRRVSCNLFHPVVLFAEAQHDEPEVLHGGLLGGVTNLPLR